VELVEDVLAARSGCGAAAAASTTPRWSPRSRRPGRAVHGRGAGESVHRHPEVPPVREVPIPGFLADELARHLAGRAPDDLAFPRPRCGLPRNSRFRLGYFDRATTSVGLEGLTPHELRHTAASFRRVSRRQKPRLNWSDRQWAPSGSNRRPAD